MSIQVMRNNNNSIWGFKVNHVLIRNASYGEMINKVLGSGDSTTFKLAYAQSLAVMYLTKLHRGSIYASASLAYERLMREEDVKAFTFSNEHGALITIDSTGGLHNYVAGETNNAASMFAIKRVTSMLPSVWMFAGTKRLVDIYTKLGADKMRLLFNATVYVRDPVPHWGSHVVYTDDLMVKLIDRMEENGFILWDERPDTPIDERAEV